MPKPACAKCGLFFRPKRNGQVFEEGMPNGFDKQVRYTADDGTPWSSYKLWNGDLWECQGCGAQILVGAHPTQPMAEHFHADYESKRTAYGGDSIPFIHDC